ncbi:MAG: sulfite exporter TauE/SafE family protein [Candidatus Melainabacteria bacterium]|nr:sulfite exporter TauE/SafE family protein [Candidatus Melainabacteria bacterium]
MEFFIIPVISFVASLLTLFSGFGLGTILLPVFAIFFPLSIAIPLVAIIHFINNILKVIILGKFANINVVAKFGLPALVSAFFGAWILKYLSDIKPVFNYSINTSIFSITALKTVIGLLIIIFALFDLMPKLQKIQFDKKYLFVGGLLSGLFGGLSGHQGALRSSFLVKCNLSKESFIGTGTVIACMVDISRLIAYSSFFSVDILSENTSLLVLTILFSMIGVLLGNKLLRKITFESIQKIVGFMLITMAVLLIAGII